MGQHYLPYKHYVPTLHHQRYVNFFSFTFSSRQYFLTIIQFTVIKFSVNAKRKLSLLNPKVRKYHTGK